MKIVGLKFKIMLGCCWFCWVRSHTNIQTPHLIISGKCRVPYGCDVNGLGSVQVLRQQVFLDMGPPTPASA